MQTKVIPIPEHLKPHVESIRSVDYTGDERMSINVCLNGLPGIVFQHHNGRSPVENITTTNACVTDIPTLFVYGQMTQPGIMNHAGTPFTTIQVILKPYALQTLLGLNASVLTNSLVDLAEFAAGSLNTQLLEARNEGERLSRLLSFLAGKARQTRDRDCLVEESLRLIHQHTGAITVRALRERLNLSERQFEKRFTQAVGLSPQFYIRVKRFNAAIHLMKSGRFPTLTSLAHWLNYYDQSHFIRDIRAFSGITPKNLLDKVETIQPEQQVYAYAEAKR